MDKMQQKLEELKKQRIALNRLIREYENREMYYGDHEMFRVKMMVDCKSTWYELAIKVPLTRCKKTSYRVLTSALTRKEILDFVKDTICDIHELQSQLEDEMYLEANEEVEALEEHEEGDHDGQDD